MSAERADLRCETCERVTDHELHYAGRLLESVRCTHCGTHLELSHRALVPAYVLDLEQRLASKPGRMLRRAARHPGAYLLALPGAVLRQPAKFLREFRDLVGAGYGLAGLRSRRARRGAPGGSARRRTRAG